MNTNPRMLISSQETKALLFDLDGTIIDNMAYHDDTWQQLLKSIGLDWSLQKVKEAVWGKSNEIMERLFPGRFSEDEIKELTLQKEVAYINNYRTHIRMIDGLESLLKKAKALDIKLAIATAAPPVCVDFVNDSIKLDQYFEQILHSDHVKKGKPDPEVYLAAAAAVNVFPKNCIVFEDAPVGVRAAEAAGMPAFVILTTHHRDDFKGLSNIKGFIRDYWDFEIE